MKKIFLILVILLFSNVAVIQAEVPYETYYYSSNSAVPGKSAYLPKATINGPFEDPVDIATHNEKIFVSDAKKGAILVFEDGKYIGTFGEAELATPQGIYIKNNLLYVADSGDKEVTVLDSNGEVVMRYTKPDEAYYGANDFIPKNVVIDNNGYLYVVCEGVSEGLVQFDAEGNFIGFFGGNELNLSLKTTLQRALYSDEKEAQTPGLQANTITNVAVDSKGQVYTVTKNSSPEIRKLNVVGTEIEKGYTEGVSDIAISKNDFVFLSYDDGLVAVIAPNGTPLFIFGWATQAGAKGVLQSGTAIAVDENYNIYVLDALGKKIEIYEPTNETLMLYEAIVYELNGEYEKSQELWVELQKENVFYYLPYKALARNAFNNGDYKQASEYYKLAYDTVGVSDSFWESRNEFIQNYFIYIILFVAIIIIAYLVVKKFVFKNKKIINMKENKFSRFFKFIKLYCLNPAEGVYQVRFKGVSNFKYALAVFVIVIFFIFMYINHTGYLFNGFKNIQGLYPPSLITIGIFFTAFTALLLGSNYLIVSVMEGEASFSNIVKTTIFSSVPIIFIMPITIFLSYILSLNEVFIYNFVVFVMLAWVFIAYVISVQQVNNFTFKQTIKNLFLTLFTMIVIIIVIFVTVILLKELATFVTDIITEVFRNVF